MRIHTKYQGPTNTRGSRMIATCYNPRRQLSISYDYDIDVTSNHNKVAYLLSKLIKGKGHFNPLVNLRETRSGKGYIYQVE